MSDLDHMIETAAAGKPDNKRLTKIAPSILAADFARLGEEIIALDKAGADYIHIDVMDGHYVPNITMGPAIVQSIRPCTQKIFDVHLMIAPVTPFIEAFAKAGSDIITVHAEAGPHIHASLQQIKNLGKKAGVSLNPGTPVEVLDYVMDVVDLILVMSVNPGFGGQQFIETQLKKIDIIRKKIDQSGRVIELEVDGGINQKTASLVKEAGADVLVAGTAIFRAGRESYKVVIDELRGSSPG